MPDIPKTIFIPRKPPEIDSEKWPGKPSDSSSLSAFEFPNEFARQYVKSEDHDNLEVKT